MSGHWGKLHPGGVGGWVRGGGGDINHKDKIDSFLAYKKLPSAEKLLLRVKTSIIKHKDSLYGTLWCPPSPPICLSCHFYFSSLYFILSSLSLPPFLTPCRIKCIRGAIHLLPLSDTGSQLSADRKGPIKHWRKGNTVGQLIFYRTSERSSELQHSFVANMIDIRGIVRLSMYTYKIIFKRLFIKMITERHFFKSVLMTVMEYENIRGNNWQYFKTEYDATVRTVNYREFFLRKTFW